MPSASKLQTTTFRNRPTLDDFSGRWLITRSDSVNLPKGALVEITPGSGNQASFKMILHQLVGSTTLTGAADFQDGCLNFTYSGNIPSSGNNPRPSWFAQATPTAGRWPTRRPAACAR